MKDWTYIALIVARLAIQKSTAWLLPKKRSQGSTLSLSWSTFSLTYSHLLLQPEIGPISTPLKHNLLYLRLGPLDLPNRVKLVSSLFPMFHHHLHLLLQFCNKYQSHRPNHFTLHPLFQISALSPPPPSYAHQPLYQLHLNPLLLSCSQPQMPVTPQPSTSLESNQNPSDFPTQNYPSLSIDLSIENPHNLSHPATSACTFT
jgi:hypothetical protein